MFSFLGILSSHIYFKPALQYSFARIIQLTFLRGSFHKILLLQNSQDSSLTMFLLLSNYIIIIISSPNFSSVLLLVWITPSKISKLISSVTLSAYFSPTFHPLAGWPKWACASFYCHCLIMYGFLVNIPNPRIWQ